MKWRCRKHGCTASYRSSDYRDAHEKRKHRRCPFCGSLFVGLGQHIGSMRRWGNQAHIEGATSQVMSKLFPKRAIKIVDRQLR